MQLGVHEAPLYHEHEHMYHQLMPAGSRWRLLRFPRRLLNITNTTASIPHLQALEVTVATTSQPTQTTHCKGLREEQAHTRHQLVIAATFTLHKTNRSFSFLAANHLLPLSRNLASVLRYPQNYGLDNGVDDDGWVDLVT